MAACAGVGPVVGMVVFQIIFAFVNIFYKLAVSDGMDLRVLIAYRYLFGSAFLGPLAYFVERKNRTKLTWRVVFLSFACGLSGGTMAQNLYIAGMKFTSATFASATTNLLPACTFVIALVFRYEKFAIRSLASQAKVAGTLLGVGGAMLLTFYKGVDITPWHSNLNLVATLTQHHHHHTTTTTTNYAMGSLLCVCSCFFYALWIVVQAKLSNEYPFHYSSTALMCIMTTLQSSIFALCFDRDASQWRLKFDIRLLSCAYSGIFASGVALVIMAWCVQQRGPLFVSVFSPLMLLIVAVLSSLLLGEKLHLGTAMGAVLIVMGLYAVLWGKGREAAAEAARVSVNDHPTTSNSNSSEEDDDKKRHVSVPMPPAPNSV
ncbi:WAT1-related protein At1g09380 [Zea mays]|uniref:WAT1-related protein n=1 Tax=Zea mays TaxID=4577 RepID=A0A1D6E509_MAIZE|nr:WAT1-related protein At1g09380 [Zea mays]ONM15582.1 MtN21 nodulin protein-like [Zea mays]